MQKLIYETMFNKLVKIGLITPDGKLTFKDYVKIENKPYMSLSVDNDHVEKFQIKINEIHSTQYRGIPHMFRYTQPIAEKILCEA